MNAFGAFFLGGVSAVIAGVLTVAQAEKDVDGFAKIVMQVAASVFAGVALTMVIFLMLRVLYE